MKKITIKGFPLVRFKSKARIESFRRGELFFNSLKWYREHEENNVVDDLFEGMLHINDATAIITPLSGGEPQVEKMNDVLMKTARSDDLVLCMFGINPKNTSSFTFNKQQKDELLKFGDTALLITDPDEFYHRIVSALERENKRWLHRFVQYYDEQIDLGNVWLSLFQDMGNTAFWKRKSYSYQQEYRFSVFNENAEENMTLSIGDISDISEVFESSQLLNSSLFEQRKDE
jgi:hypothetical protein